MGKARFPQLFQEIMLISSVFAGFCEVLAVLAGSPAPQKQTRRPAPDPVQPLNPGRKAPSYSVSQGTPRLGCSARRPPGRPAGSAESAWPQIQVRAPSEPAGWCSG